MAKRTPDNCGIIKKHGEPGRDTSGKCMGFGKTKRDHEPREPCKKCKYYTGYEEETENE